MLIVDYYNCQKPELQGQVTTNVTVRQTTKDCVNKKVFRCYLKVATDDAVTTSVDRLHFNHWLRHYERKYVDFGVFE